MPRRILPLGLALCVGLLSGLVWVAPANAVVFVPAPKPSVSRPILNEVFTLTGSLGRSTPRKIRLQRLHRGKWRTVQTRGTGKLGRYRFTVRQPTTTARWRVVAPRFKRGRTWKQRMTRAVTLTRQGQAGAVAVPPSVKAGTPATVTARFSPARPGRPVELQALVAGTWSRVATGVQDGNGQAHFSYVSPTRAWLGFRAVTASARGAAPVVTGTARMAALGAATVLVAAHRGASATHPENTLPAIQEAIDQKADFIELDFRRTSDGEWVLMHDGNLLRTTDIESSPTLAARQNDGINKFALAEIKTLDAGSWKHPRFACTIGSLPTDPCRIPTMEEALDLVRVSGYAGRLILEVKELSGANADRADQSRLLEFYDRVQARYPEWVSHDDRDDKAIVMTFDEGAARYLNDMRGTAPTEALADARPDGVEVAVVMERAGLDLRTVSWTNQIHIKESLWGPRTPDAVDVVGDAVLAAAWTVNSVGDIARVAGLGTDIVTTDDVPLACEVLLRTRACHS